MKTNYWRLRTCPHVAWRFSFSNKVFGLRKTMQLIDWWNYFESRCFSPWKALIGWTPTKFKSGHFCKRNFSFLEKRADVWDSTNFKEEEKKTFCLCFDIVDCSIVDLFPRFFTHTHTQTYTPTHSLDSLTVTGRPKIPSINVKRQTFSRVKFGIFSLSMKMLRVFQRSEKQISAFNL